MTGRQLLDGPKPAPLISGSRFGCWILRKRGRQSWLGHKGDHGYGYEVDLDRCRSSAEILDWIAQLEQKTWCDATCVGNLVRALNRILRLQGNFCGGGVERGRRS
jgi:hypothetical protein